MTTDGELRRRELRNVEARSQLSIFIKMIVSLGILHNAFLEEYTERMEKFGVLRSGEVEYPCESHLIDELDAHPTYVTLLCMFMAFHKGV